MAHRRTLAAMRDWPVSRRSANGAVRPLAAHSRLRKNPSSHRWPQKADANALHWQQWIPHSGKALPSKVLFIGGGKVRDAMMPQRLGQTQVDEATEGKTGLGCLRPDFFHYMGRLNERPCPVLAIGLANGRRLRRGQWAREYLLISELQIQLHQHQFTHRNILPQGEREQKLLRGFMPRRGSIRGVNGNICVKAGHQQG